MTLSETVQSKGVFHGDTWRWWQGRRLRYNLTLAVGGWAAYGAGLGLNYAFHHPMWRDWRGGVGMTLFMGVDYLIVMGFANVFYLLGPAVESWTRPADVDHYRRTAFAMGNWGSLIVPAVFPLMQLAMLLAKAGGV